MKQCTRPLWLAGALICLNLGCSDRPSLTFSAESREQPELQDSSSTVGTSPGAEETSPSATLVDEGGASQALPAAPTRPASNRPVRISFEDLQPDRYAQPVAGKFPREIEDLSGKRVRISGYMLPSLQQTGILEFVLVRDNMQCCFGANINPFDCIVVHMDADRPTHYDIDPVTVDGIFELEEAESTDFPVFYSISAARVSVAH